MECNTNCRHWEWTRNVTLLVSQQNVLTALNTRLWGLHRNNDHIIEITTLLRATTTTASTNTYRSISMQNNTNTHRPIGTHTYKYKHLSLLTSGSTNSYRPISTHFRETPIDLSAPIPKVQTLIGPSAPTLNNTNIHRPLNTNSCKYKHP